MIQEIVSTIVECVYMMMTQRHERGTRIRWFQNRNNNKNTQEGEDEEVVSICVCGIMCVWQRIIKYHKNKWNKFNLNVAQKVIIIAIEGYVMGMFH